MKISGARTLLLGTIAQLRFKQLCVLTTVLLLLDLVIPDPVPFVDELLLAVLTAVFWGWRRPPSQPVRQRMSEPGTR